MANSYELLLKIGGQLSGSFTKSTSEASKALSGIQKGVGTIKSALLGAAGALGVGIGLKSVITSAEESEKTLAQMDAVLKSTGDASGLTKKQLLDLADSQAKVTTFSKGTTEQAENMLLTFTGIGKNVFPETLQATEDMATAMHMDATQAAMTLGKALNDPSTGLSKLTKQGVTFTTAQKKQIIAMQKAGNTAGAQKIILQELEREFGGSAKAAGSTFAGQLTIAQNTLKGVGVTIGSALLPVLNSLLPQLVGIAQQFGNFVKNHQTDIKNMAMQAGNFATSLVKNVIPIVKDIINFVISHKTLVLGVITGIGAAVASLKIAATINSFIGPIHTAITEAKKVKVAADGIKTSLKGLKLGGQIFKNIFGFSPQLLLIIIAITAIAALAFIIIKNWKPISAWFKNLWSGIVGVFNKAKAVIGNILKGIGDFFKKWGPLILTFIAPVIGIPLLIIQHWKQISTFFVNLWNGIKSVTTSAGNAIKDIAIKIWTGIKTAVLALVSPLVKGVTTLWNNMKGGIQTAMNGLRNILQGIWNVIKNVVLGPVLLICDLVTGNFGKLRSDAVKIFQNLQNAFRQIWDGIKQYFSGILQAIAAFFRTIWQGIVNVAKAAFNGLKQFFTSLWNGILNLGKTVFTALANFFTGLWNGIKNTAINIWNGILAFFRGIPQVFSNIGNGIKNIWSGVVNFFASLPGRFASIAGNIGNGIKHGFDSAINFIRNLPGQMLQWGADMINGLINGIKNAIGGIGKAVSGVANTIRSFLHFSQPDTGPLKDAPTYGPDFIKLIGSGIKKNVGTLKKAAKDAANAMSDGFNPNDPTAGRGKAGIGGSGNLTAASSSRGGSGTAGAQPVQITWSPQIIIKGDASKQDIEDALDDSQRKFDEHMKTWMHNNKRVSFA